MTEVQTPQPPPSPGVGARRKNPKSLPRLPLSAFSPPNSGTSDKFPLPPSPSTIHPAAVLDAHVSLDDVQAWTGDVGRVAVRSVQGVVLALPEPDAQAAIDRLQHSHPNLKIVSAVIPLNPVPGSAPAVRTLGGNTRVALSVPFTKNTPELVEGLRRALEEGYVVDVEVRAPVGADGAGWEGLEELLSAVLGSSKPSGAIVLSNILPPPHDLGISIVKLLNHPSYRAYQNSTASLSLFPSVFVKYVPPQWGARTPAGTVEESKEAKEWKRRIKMFLGPAVEAFGYQRIIYGSGGEASDWYEIARESLAELGVDEEGVNAVFGGNAAAVYGGGC